MNPAVEQFLMDGLDHPLEIVVVTKRHEEVERLLARIADLEDQLDRSRQDLITMTRYADLYLQALDEIKALKKTAVSLIYEGGVG